MNFKDFEDAAAYAPLLSETDTSISDIFADDGSLLNAVCVGSIEDFAQLHSRAIEFIKGYKTTKELATDTLHEVQHAEAVQRLAGEVMCFGVKFGQRIVADWPTVTYYEQPFVRWESLPPHVPPVLGKMSVTAYPQEPSAGDISDLAVAGYDVDKVGYEATAYNDQNGYLIPVPLSYRTKNPVYFT